MVGRAEEDEAKATPASDDSVALSKQEFRPFELVAREAAGVMTTRFTFALPAGQRLVRAVVLHGARGLHADTTTRTTWS